MDVLKEVGKGKGKGREVEEEEDGMEEDGTGGEGGGRERESRPFVRETEMQAGHETTENEASVCEALPGFA